MVRIKANSGIWKPMGEVLAGSLSGNRHPFTDAVDEIFSRRTETVRMPIGEAKPLLDWLTTEYPDSVTWEILS